MKKTVDVKQELADLFIEEVKEQEKKIKEFKTKKNGEYSLDNLPGNPCVKCLVCASCQKEFANKTACRKYFYFLKRLIRESQRESKKRLRNK